MNAKLNCINAPFHKRGESLSTWFKYRLQTNIPRKKVHIDNENEDIQKKENHIRLYPSVFPLFNQKTTSFLFPHTFVNLKKSKFSIYYQPFSFCMYIYIYGEEYKGLCDWENLFFLSIFRFQFTGCCTTYTKNERRWRVEGIFASSRKIETSLKGVTEIKEENRNVNE